MNTDLTPTFVSVARFVLAGEQIRRIASVSWHRKPFIQLVVAIAWGLCFASGLPAFQTESLPPKQAVDHQLGPTPGLSQSEIEAGWLSLFDGETLFGWQPVTDTNWHVAEGEIRADKGAVGLLRTTTEFDDYELKLEFKGETRTNSGIFLRTSPQPKNLLTDCYELNIANRLDHQFPTGSLVSRIAAKQDFQTDEWRQLRVVVAGPQVNVWIDDELAIEYIDPKPIGRGYIGLQHNSGAIAFRKIGLKPLNVPEMELTPELKGWNAEQNMASEFSVTDQHELRIVNGRGQLETVNQFADLIFSLKCKTNADGLNSGIFFRCIPGELTNGYESQIHNGFKNNDRTQPVDCGTGGIFRRVNARRVNANDQEWFSKTIIATGSHVGVWVNGYQVTDWSDQRAPDPNPRQGRRVSAGTIMLQGHDPTTDILMKDFHIREVNSRRTE